MAILNSFIKQPVDEIDYDISYHQYLTDSDSLNTVTGPDVAITPVHENGLERGAVSVTDDRIKIWVMNGVPGTTYKVEVTAHTNEGRVRQDEFFVIVEDF